MPIQAMSCLFRMTFTQLAFLFSYQTVWPCGAVVRPRKPEARYLYLGKLHNIDHLPIFCALENTRGDKTVRAAGLQSSRGTAKGVCK